MLSQVQISGFCTLTKKQVQAPGYFKGCHLSLLAAEWSLCYQRKLEGENTAAYQKSEYPMGRDCWCSKQVSSSKLLIYMF